MELEEDSILADRCQICQTGEVELGEFGVYDLSMTGGGHCTFAEALEPVNPNLSLLYAFLVLLLLGAAHRAFKICWDRGLLDGVVNPLKRTLAGIGFDVRVKDGEEEEGAQEQQAQKKRLKSLDTFRGFSMAILIFANDGSAG